MGTLRHIRREPKLGFLARFMGRKPALRTYCGAPIAAGDIQAQPTTIEGSGVNTVRGYCQGPVCLACYSIATSPSERRAEIRRAVDSPN